MKSLLEIFKKPLNHENQLVPPINLILKNLKTEREREERERREREKREREEREEREREMIKKCVCMYMRMCGVYKRVERCCYQKMQIYTDLAWTL